MARPSQLVTRLRIAYAVLGILIGLSIFFTFGFVYHNWDAAIFGLLSGGFAAVALGVSVEYAHCEWKRRSHWLRPLTWTGCLGQLVGLAAFIVYLTMAIVEGQPLTAYGPRGYYLASIWAFMTWKWGFVLFYTTRAYKKLYEESTGMSSDVPYEKM